jgi:hypothetical protein
VNRTGLRQYPWGAPMLVSNGAKSAVPIFACSVVLLSRMWTILKLSSSVMLLSPSSILWRSSISNALLMSAPRMKISSRAFMIRAISHLCAQAASDVLLFCRKPLWLFGKTLSTASRMRFKVISESVLRSVVSRTIGRRLLIRPGGFLGLGRIMRVPRIRDSRYSRTSS